MQQLVLDRVKPLLDEPDRLEIRGGDRIWGIFRITAPDERGPHLQRFTLEHQVDDHGRPVYSPSMVTGYSIPIGSGLGTWIPLTPDPIRVKLAVLEALEGAAQAASGHPSMELDLDPTWPQAGSVARTRLRRDRVECW